MTDPHRKPSLLARLLLVALVRNHSRIRRELRDSAVETNRLKADIRQKDRELKDNNEELRMLKLEKLERQLEETTKDDRESIHLSAADAHKMTADMLLEVARANAEKDRMKESRDLAHRALERAAHSPSSTANAHSKRHLESHDLDLPSVKKQKHGHKKVPCTHCYQYKLMRKCDDGAPCWPCIFLGTECKRMKCNNFETGTCQKSQCTMAHEDDDFPDASLVPQGHVGQIIGPAPYVPKRVT
ncbi:hypothetical protein BDV96DRAFT_639613 [Lophiotrema nucula]|uniref:C3H1-type domain-containing protein n=1 Tax=Lophiotrema nucula TaxID=690887 RepID=A0A6A5ZVI5_9PLEO|nr:hypothetical protein BDV96DRAFT_639613 [Lophiotrema nucula]